ncbi:hypothetical protein EW146_g7533 [Bondarzewia mesenterica]|uniref:Major facilitator superfamily (MFS) profile domain-containing protein n=1 Tax=Bondarzewia mesenterica TaxID=1095465 RepID=A0A4S4LKN5_9AGAM|nr:hypothetical protein EW146_g7533 [Bondarzewia mesenterica]
MPRRHGVSCVTFSLPEAISGGGRSTVLIVGARPMPPVAAAQRFSPSVLAPCLDGLLSCPGRATDTRARARKQIADYEHSGRGTRFGQALRGGSGRPAARTRATADIITFPIGSIAYMSTFPMGRLARTDGKEPASGVLLTGLSKLTGVRDNLGRPVYPDLGATGCGHRFVDLSPFACGASTSERRSYNLPSTGPVSRERLEHTMTVKARMSKVSLIFAAGTALFSDGYANGVIGSGAPHVSFPPQYHADSYLSVNTLLTRIYGKEAVSAHNYSKTLSSVAFAGTVVGMLVFGYVSDKVGRKFGMMLATGIVALFSGLSAASSGAHHSFGGMLAMLSACRFLLGIGVGAEYPCGSVAASEQSEEEGINKKAQHRWFALATNTMIDFGFVVSAFVPLVLYWIFGPNHLRAVWRLSLGLGVIPAVAVFIWRLNMEEPTRFRKDSMKNAKIPYLLIIRRYWKSLAAISATWFIYDFIVYPFSIYSSTVVSNITNGSDALSVVFGWNVVIKYPSKTSIVDRFQLSHLHDFPSIGTVGGAFIVDYLGPKNTMIAGLLCQAVIGFIMSGLYKQLTRHIGAFAVVYGIFLSFGEVGAQQFFLTTLPPTSRRWRCSRQDLKCFPGPGNCLGLLAAKTGPTAVRGQFYGIAAAVGKVGAFVGTWAFPPIINDFGGDTTTKGNTGPFWIASALAVFSALITLTAIKPLTQDGMLKEDQEFRAYLDAHGWDTSVMGSSSEEWSQDLPEEKETADAKIV